MGTFATLWANHPANQVPRVIEPCATNGVRHHANQCVIRLGIALSTSGVSLASFNGTFCWNGHGRRHPLRVEEIKEWINSDAATFAPSYAEKYVRDRQGRQQSHHSFIGRQGIVAFLNFWGTGNTGDHIDLWDGSSIAYGQNNYFELSQEIWFWQIP